MSGLSLTGAVLTYGPLLALGLVAGALRALAQRPDLPPRRRRVLAASWVLVLLVGAPFWLFLAAALRIR